MFESVLSVSDTIDPPKIRRKITCILVLSNPQSCTIPVTMTVHLRLAVCLYPGLTALDYQGSVELFGFISSESLNSGIGLLPLPQPYTIETTFLSHDMEPVKPSSGPRVLPNASYVDDVG
jgi:hypothetical protein